MLLIDANDFLSPPPHQIVQNTWGGGVLTKRFLADKTIGIKLFICNNEAAWSFPSKTQFQSSNGNCYQLEWIKDVLP